MSPTSDDIPILERPSFFEGQRLTAADLTDVQQFHQQLRWLHNRSLHSWGIAFGYQALGNRGDRTVQISAGYAIDCEGRDLILTEPMTLAIPVVAGDISGDPVSYYLTASYAPDDRIPAENQASTCGSSGAVRRPERPLIRWQSPTDTDPTSRFRQGEDVILAAIKVQNCQLAEAASSQERRDAVPSQQPYISAGQTDPKQTTWRLYPDEQNPLGVVTTVSTTSAGFRITPRHQAHVVGERIFEGEISLGDPPTNQRRNFVVDGYTQIGAMTAAKFDLIMFLPSGASAGTMGSDFVRGEDITTLLTAIGVRTGIQLGFLQIFLSNLPLTTGQSYPIFIPIPPFTPQIVTLQQSDFNTVLNTITQRNQITEATLLDANSFKRENLSLQVGQSLRIPGKSLPLNPSDVVLKASFLPLLKEKLNWSVVWMGIEG
jgi:hypothetical protein